MDMDVAFGRTKHHGATKILKLIATPNHNH